jgi:hypothetical protein
MRGPFFLVARSHPLTSVSRNKIENPRNHAAERLEGPNIG